MRQRKTTLLLLLIMSLAVFVPARANSQLTVFADGDEFSNTSPINLVYMDEAATRCQVLYPAAQLAEMNGEPINSMTFYVADEGITINGGRVRVSVAETDQTAFGNDYINDGLVQVATITMTAGTKQLVISFDQPFMYHGGNLLLDTYVEEAATDCYSLFEGYRPSNYATFTRGEVAKFIPKTTFDFGTDDEYAAKVLPTEVTFNVTRAEREDVQAVVLKNIGKNPFTPTFDAEAPFGVIAPNAVLAPGQSVEVPVTFKPMAEGDYTGTLNIDCGPAGILTVALNGKAIHAATDLVICDSIEYASYVPIYGIDIDVVGTESQVIYPAEMLTDMVGGQIHSLRFHTHLKMQMNGGTIQLSFKVVEKDAFDQEALDTDLTAVATATPVFEGYDLVFDLDEPFDYNGGNLMVGCKIIEPGITNYKQTFFYGIPVDYNSGVCKSLWYGNVFEINLVPFLPKATFSYVKDSANVLRGDVNRDGEVNISDVTGLIDLLLKEGNAPVEADCNQDGEINISDVTVMIDYLLSGNW